MRRPLSLSVRWQTPYFFNLSRYAERSPHNHHFEETWHRQAIEELKNMQRRNQLPQGKEWKMHGEQVAVKQEQTRFDDLRRGFTEDFKRLAKFKGLCQKAPKKSPILSDSRFWPFLTSKWPQNSNLTWSAQHNLGVPEIFNLIIFFVWALLRP